MVDQHIFNPGSDVHLRISGAKVQFVDEFLPVLALG